MINTNLKDSYIFGIQHSYSLDGKETPTGAQLQGIITMIETAAQQNLAAQIQNIREHSYQKTHHPLFFTTPSSVIFVPQKTSGIGGFKTMKIGVRVPHDNSGYHLVAVLIIQEGKEQDGLNIREKTMLESFQGQNIVPNLFESFRTTISIDTAPKKLAILGVHNYQQKEHYIFIESLCKGGDLRTLIRTSPLSPNRVAMLAFQMLRIENLFHQKGFVIRDIKPDNFLLTGAANNLLRMCDLALVCKEGAPDPTDSKLAGTPLYISPESAVKMLLSSPGETANTKPADIWATGITIIELLNHKKLLKAAFPNKNNTRGINLLLEDLVKKKNLHQIDPQEPCIVQLAAKFLHHDPLLRPTAQQALQDPLLLRSLVPNPEFLAILSHDPSSQDLMPIDDVYETLLGVRFENLFKQYTMEKEHEKLDTYGALAGIFSEQLCNQYIMQMGNAFEMAQPSLRTPVLTSPIDHLPRRPTSSRSYSHERPMRGFLGESAPTPTEELVSSFALSSTPSHPSRSSQPLTPQAPSTPIVKEKLLPQRFRPRPSLQNPSPSPVLPVQSPTDKI